MTPAGRRASAAPGARRRVAIAAALAAAALVIAAAFASVARHAYRDPKVRRFDYYAAPLPEDRYRALGRAPWAAVRLEVDRGVSLRGLVRTAVDPQAPVVLYFPGNSSSVLADAEPFLDALLGSRDWGAVVWAYRGFDGSLGEPSPDALYADGWRAYESLVESHPRGADAVHVIGFSLGTSIAAFVAARAAASASGRPSAASGDRGRSPATLTLVAPLTTVDVRHGWLGPDRYETLPFVGAIAGPALVVHGDADDQLPIEGGHAIAARLGARGRFALIPGAGHLGVLHADATLEAIRRFMAANAR